ncbi:MAG: AAA family ATPase [Sulfurovum sp.]|nr:AAA family ATPase [Sulfurovum sp.]
MKLQQIIIKKFRSIEKAEMLLNEVNAIVGQNNSGKSAIIRALNCFFNYDKEEYNFIKGVHTYTNKSTSILEFNFLADSITSPLLHDYIIDGNINIQMKFKAGGKKRTIRIKNSTNKYETVDESFLVEIKKFITFVYIPPIRDNSDIKWEESALLKELIEEFINKETEKRDNITPALKKSTKFLEDGVLQKVAKSLKNVYSLSDSFDYELSFGEKSNILNFFNGLELNIVENEKSFDLLECGTGIQSLTIIALHRVLAKLRHKNVILGLEEPETNLHPQAQRELISSIKNYTSDSELSQIILTTHSPVLIDNIKHENISLVRKTPESSRGFKSVVSSVSKNSFELYGIEEFNYYQYHHYRNSDFFYAKKIIIVESKNDAEVVKFIAKKEKVNLDLLGISIINIDGVKNLNYPLFLIRELKIPYVIILDKDYFLPYLNDELKLSRNAQGFPKYRYSYKTDIILHRLINKEQDRDDLLSLLESNHSKALDLAEKYNLIIMKYNLEIDLMCSSKSVEKYSTLLNLTKEQSNKKYLLVDCHKKIKSIGNILKVLDSLENSNLPSSYKRIRKIIKNISK